MGVIGEGKEAIAQAGAQAEQLAADGKSKAIQEIMDGLSDTLAEPTYTGDVETALIHHMGEEAFHDDEVTGRYTELVEPAGKEAEKTDGRAVPVLMVYKEHPDSDVKTTVFIRVPEGNVQFTSKVEEEEGVRMHAFTGRMVKNEETDEEEWEPTTATVTHRLLSLEASASTFIGDLLESDEPISVKEDAVHGLVLSESHVAEGGYGSGMPSDYAFRNHSINRLGGDIDSMNDEDPVILAGWEEIDNAIVQRLKSGGEPSMEEIERVQKFFRVIAGIAGTEPTTPRADSITNAVVKLQSVVAEA